MSCTVVLYFVLLLMRVVLRIEISLDDILFLAKSHLGVFWSIGFPVFLVESIKSAGSALFCQFIGDLGLTS